MARLPQHDDEVTTQHIPKLLDTVLQAIPANPDMALLAEELFRITAVSCWAKGTDPDIGEAYARIVKNSLRLTLDPRHVLTSINMGKTLLEVEVLPPMDCQQWKLDLLDVLQKVCPARSVLTRRHHSTL